MLNDGFRDLGERLALDYLLIDTHPGVNEETLLSIAIFRHADPHPPAGPSGLPGNRR